MAETAGPVPPEIIEVDETEVACDGGPFGHPRVFLAIGERGEVVCPYCDRLYRLKAGARPGAAR